jgi:hypothetical protein
MGTTLRLLFKTHRFELIAITLACLALAGGELFMSSQLGAVALPPDCVFVQGSDSQGQASDPAHEQACQVKRDAYFALQGHVGEILGFGAALPLLAGIVLGVPLVGRELESGTASLAWTLSRSRRRWLLARAIPLMAILSVVLLIPALAADILEHARQPLVDPGSSFSDAGVRGPVFVLRGVMAFAVGVISGAIVGRQIPALIIAIAMSLAVLVGFEVGVTRWEHSLAEWRPAASFDINPADLQFDQQYRDRATGAIVDTNAVMATAPQVNGGADSAWIDDHYVPVSLGLLGSQYGVVVAGETAALGGLSLLGLGLGLMVVNRRRPG